MPRMPLVAIALISAGLLAYEVLLTRLFAIIQWHHFAYMVISIALLGYGASGTFLAFAQDRLSRRFVGVFALCAALFAISAVAGFAVAQRLPFNALAVIWKPSQLLYLVVLYLLLTVPFALNVRISVRSVFWPIAMPGSIWRLPPPIGTGVLLRRDRALPIRLAIRPPPTGRRGCTRDRRSGIAVMAIASAAPRIRPSSTAR